MTIIINVLIEKKTLPEGHKARKTFNQLAKLHVYYKRMVKNVWFPMFCEISVFNQMIATGSSADLKKLTKKMSIR